MPIAFGKALTYLPFVMNSPLDTYMREFAQLRGVSIERVSTGQARQDKVADRLRDAQDITSGRFTATQIGQRNSAGLDGGFIVMDKSPAYR